MEMKIAMSGFKGPRLAAELVTRGRDRLMRIDGWRAESKPLRSASLIGRWLRCATIIPVVGTNRIIVDL